MKAIIFSLVIIFLSAVIGFAQIRKDNHPKQSKNSNNLTFYEIRKQFYDYWKPYNVINGYYYKNGKKIKAAGWKQFKRWEWFWEPRVNPVTGEFPKTTAWKEFEKYKSKYSAIINGKANWTNIGPYESPGGYAGLGRINCIAFHPFNNNIIYAGSPSGGLWKTSNGGNTWQPLTDNNPVLGVSDIIVVPNGNTEIIYIATGDRDKGSLSSLGGGQFNDNNSIGVLKSVDGGNTWQATGLSFDQASDLRVNRLLLHPNDPDIIYAATSEGLYKTVDAGANWSLLTNNMFADIEFKPGNPQIMYATSEKYYVPAYIFRSTDGGNNWSVVKQFLNSARIELAVTPAAPSRVYALVAEIAGDLKGIYRSDNSGFTFVKTFDGTLPSHNLLGWNCHGATPGGQGMYDLALAADPNNANVVFLGGISTWKSTDGGNSWDISSHWKTNNCNAPIVHADKHYLVFQNSTSILFEANDGGIYKTVNGGATWEFIGSGIAVSQMYRLGVSGTYPGMVNAGLQDNGSKSIQDNVWFDIFPGDGMETIIDFTQSSTQYVCQPHGKIFRTKTNWATSQQILGGVTGDGAWVTPYVIDPNNHNTLYAGLTELMKSTNQGDSWTQISNFNNDTSDKIKSIAVAKANSNYIYCSTNNILYRTTNGGVTWTNITGSLPVSQSLITYISVKYDDPNTIWVAMGEYNEHGVYQSTDGGNTWTNISAGLPALPVMCVIQNRQNTTATELYAATDRGVYVKTGLNDWQLFSNGLPNVVVTELEIYYDDNNPENSKLYAATYGRGMWVSNLLPRKIEVQLTVNLEGAFNGTDMDTWLTQIPLTQPYNTQPWNYSGNETVASIPAGVVDWVLVELRDATSASVAGLSTVICRQAAFLMYDGSVRDMTGSNVLSFDGSISNSLFVVIWHRNHLGVMSAQSLNPVNGVYSYNFNSGNSYNSGMKNVNGTYVMTGGDADSDGHINSSDLQLWKTNAGKRGYDNTDVNLDGQTDNSDKNDIIIENTGSNCQVPN